MTSALRVHEDGQPIDFTYEAILDYHGRSAPAGVAHALKVMERAFPLLDPTGPLERREVVIATAFAGPGARDAFEAVTRAVTGDRYTVDPRLAAPQRGPPQLSRQIGPPPVASRSRERGVHRPRACR
jgi:hypothetical protein